MYDSISMDRAGSITTEDFLAICSTMFDGADDQKSIAAGLGISQQSVSNFRRGMQISARSGRKILAAWNAFAETGEAPKAPGLIDGSDDDTGTRPFVAVPMARDRDSGRMYRADQISSGLIGNTAGPILSDEEVVARIDGRFNVMVQIVRRMLRGKVRSCIVRAAAGVGKTYTIERELARHKAEKPDFYAKVLSGGGVSASALYKALYHARKGGVVVLDDNDSMLDSDETLNMIKNALDSSDKRVLTWSKRNAEVYNRLAMEQKADREHAREVEKKGDDARSWDQVFEDLTFGMIPDEFEFEGAMIFITNLDFHAIAEAGGARGNHVAAMMDRSFHLNLTINNLRDKTLWCNHIFRAHMADGLDAALVEDICGYVATNANKFATLSLRLFLAIRDLATDPEDTGWKEIIEATKFKPTC